MESKTLPYIKRKVYSVELYFCIATHFLRLQNDLSFTLPNEKYRKSKSSSTKLLFMALNHQLTFMTTYIFICMCRINILQWHYKYSNDTNSFQIFSYQTYKYMRNNSDSQLSQFIIYHMKNSSEIQVIIANITNYFCFT